METGRCLLPARVRLHALLLGVHLLALSSLLPGKPGSPHRRCRRCPWAAPRLFAGSLTGALSADSVEEEVFENERFSRSVQVCRPQRPAVKRHGWCLSLLLCHA